MELKEFVAGVPNFAALQHPDRILLFGWYIHIHKAKDRFSQADVRNCYRELPMPEPNLSEQFKRLLDKRPHVLLEDSRGYHLAHATRLKYDEKHLQHETTIALSKLLHELPGKISDDAEKLFLSEAIKCYRVRAFRAAIVMTWNLTYDHLLNWILADTSRTAAFQANIAGRVGPKKGAAIAITNRESFEDLKEAETLDICESANLFASTNTKKILGIQLTKRNLAAHPSLLIMGGPEAEDTIASLINNVVLVLK